MNLQTSNPNDGIMPGQRTASKPAGYQQWRSLLFLHWPIAIDDLRGLVPRGLELDLFEGTAYVGVVPFVMQNVRPRCWPRAAALSFLETNVRTYVRYDGQPGVFFLSLDANSRWAVRGARWFWELPYFDATMSMQTANDLVEYRSRRRRSGAGFHVRYEVGESLGPSAPGTIQHFLLERYLLFAQRRGGGFRIGQVRHSPYPVQAATVHQVHDELIAAAGLPAVDGTPDWVHYSPGVDVRVFATR